MATLLPYLPDMMYGLHSSASYNVMRVCVLFVSLEYSFWHKYVIYVYIGMLLIAKWLAIAIFDVLIVVLEE